MINRQNAIDSEKLHELQKCNLYNEKTFYREFTRDMLKAKKEIIIYSPFVTKFRSDFFRHTFTELRRRNISIFIFTRPLEEHDYLMRSEISCALKDYEELGILITYLPGFVHEKLAIIDREILWEGSLNILSQRTSREMMRKTTDKDSTMQVMTYLGLNKKLVEGYKLQYELLVHGLIKKSKRDFKLKIWILSLGMIIPIIAMWLFTSFKAIIILMQSVFKLINFIFK
jgi:phosphatidylserine/phosphatidylglycerophosphate/cardiolipin synthase-like enzyme